MLALIDTHHHFYDPTAHYYPWLNDAGAPPHRSGDHTALKRPYLPADYARDTAGVKKLTRLVTRSPSWAATIVPIRDGVLVATRL